MNGYIDTFIYYIPVATPPTAPFSTFSRRVRYVRDARGEAITATTRSRVRPMKRTVSYDLNTNVAAQFRSRAAAKKTRRTQLVYAPLTAFTLNPTGQFTGTVKLNGVTPLFDCIVRVYDLETGIEAGRSTVDMSTGAYTVVGLVPGRAYTVEVANRVYDSTQRLVQLGIIVV